MPNYRKAEWPGPEFTRFNTVICEEDGNLVLLELWDKHVETLHQPNSDDRRKEQVVRSSEEIAEALEKAETGSRSQRRRVAVQTAEEPPG